MNKLPVSIIRTKLFVCALAIAALASASQAFAQGADLKVKVPFAFESGSQHFPAATYTIRFESSHVMLVQGSSTRGFVMTLPTESVKAAGTGRVVFERYGDRYFLRQVWAPEATTGDECMKSRQEARAQIAQEKAKVPNVQLTLNTSH
jgi:hypothetical protein